MVEVIKWKCGIVVFFVMCFLCACTPVSNQEMTRYANVNYGEAQLMGLEIISEDEVVYHFKDSEYGFVYDVGSKMSEISFYDTVFGVKEAKYSNFDISYYDFVTKCVNGDLKKLEKLYNVDIATSFNDSGCGSFAKIRFLTADITKAAEVSKRVNDLYMSYDTRNFWKGKTDVFDKDNERIGGYYSYKNEWMTADKEKEAYYVRTAQLMDKDSVYLGKEERLFRDTDIQADMVIQATNDEVLRGDSVITYYYFDSNGMKFFIVDVLLEPEGMWGTNYWEEKEKLQPKE